MTENEQSDTEIHYTDFVNEFNNILISRITDLDFPMKNDFGRDIFMTYGVDNPVLLLKKMVEVGMYEDIVGSRFLRYRIKGKNEKMIWKNLVVDGISDDGNDLILKIERETSDEKFFFKDLQKQSAELVENGFSPCIFWPNEISYLLSPALRNIISAEDGVDIATSKKAQDIVVSGKLFESFPDLSKPPIWIYDKASALTSDCMEISNAFSENKDYLYYQMDIKTCATINHQYLKILYGNKKYI